MNLLYQINKIWNHFWKHKWSVQLKKVPGWQLAWLKLKYSRKAYFLKVFCWQHAAVLKFRTKLSGLFVRAGLKKKRKTETSSTWLLTWKWLFNLSRIPNFQSDCLNSRKNLPDAWEESAEQEGAVSLHEGGEEGEDTVDGQRDEQRLPAAYPVGQRPPEEGPDHHPEIYNQTCRESRKNDTCKMLKKRKRNSHFKQALL